MPEGDTIFRAARTLHRALAGERVTRFETQLAQLAAVDRRSPVTGRSIVEVVPRGKHLIVAMTGDLFLRTHMRMHGSWHIYRPGERWRAPRREARIVIATAGWVAIAFSVTDAEFLTHEQLERHARIGALGPDLLSPDVDFNEARRRIRGTPARHIADALLRQQSVAGLGNVFKSELLFLCRVHPFTPVDRVSDREIECLLTRGRTLMRLNVDEAAPPGAGTSRRTTGRLNAREPLWVYGRSGRPCLRCATPIATRSDTDGRRTFWCPACQRASS